jgi:hypothetical protein
MASETPWEDDGQQDFDTEPDDTSAEWKEENDFENQVPDDIPDDLDLPDEKTPEF